MRILFDYDGSTFFSIPIYMIAGGGCNVW